MCEGGLVVAYEHRSAHAVGWAKVREWRKDVRGPGLERSDVLVVEGEGADTETPIGTVSRRGDLVRALVTRAPASRDLRRGVRVAAAAVVLAGVLGWLAKWQSGGRMPDATLSIEVARYVVDVYELRTHRKVASRQIDGDEMACPESILASEGHIYSTISDETFHRLLDPLARS